MILTAGESLRFELESAVSTLEPHISVSYNTTSARDRTLEKATVGTGTTPVEILAEPDLDLPKVVEGVVVANRDDDVILARITRYDGATDWVLWRGELDVGERVVYTPATAWRVKTPDGGDR